MPFTEYLPNIPAVEWTIWNLLHHARGLLPLVVFEQFAVPVPDAFALFLAQHHGYDLFRCWQVVSFVRTVVEQYNISLRNIVGVQFLVSADCKHVFVPRLHQKRSFSIVTNDLLYFCWMIHNNSRLLLRTPSLKINVPENNLAIINIATCTYRVSDTAQELEHILGQDQEELDQVFENVSDVVDDLYDELEHGTTTYAPIKRWRQKKVPRYSRKGGLGSNRRPFTTEEAKDSMKNFVYMMDAWCEEYGYALEISKFDPFVTEEKEFIDITVETVEQYEDRPIMKASLKDHDGDDYGLKAEIEYNSDRLENKFKHEMLALLTDNVLEPGTVDGKHGAYQ